MAHSVPLPRLCLDGDLQSNWAKFRQIWDSYELVTGLKDKDDKIRVATFVTAIGSEALDIHNNLPYMSDEDKEKMIVVLQLWDKHCKGATNVIYERFKFNNCTQGSDSFDAFVVKLRSLAKSCDFGQLRDSLIRDRIVCGVTDSTLQKRLLQESELTYEGCIKIGQAYYATKHQMNAMTKSDESVSYVKTSKHRDVQARVISNCKYCGGTHQVRKCPAYGKVCTSCGRQNHFAQVCRITAQSKDKRKYTHATKKHVAKVVEDENSSSSTTDDEVLIVNDIESLETNSDSKIIAMFSIKGKKVSMQIDSGATCNVMPKKNLPLNTEMHECKKKLTLYGGKATITTVGECTLKVKNVKNHKKYDVQFVVVEEDCLPLIGLRMAQVMNLIKVQQKNIQVASVSDTDRGNVRMETKDDVLKAHPNVFKGRGKMPGKVHLQVDKTVTPVVMPPRRVPLSVKDRLKEELGRLEKLGYIAPVVQPTEWVSSLVTVHKPNGKIRVCIDPLHLNKALQRGHYPLPQLDDVLPNMSQAQVFTKADCKEGFLQIELDEESSLLTTFQTPWGRYRWKRMPFGISPAPEIFQQFLDQNLEGLIGVHKIADDIIITGSGANPVEANRDHDRNLHDFLKRCEERGIRLNEEKFAYKCEQVKFMGHILSKDGLKIDPDKVAAIDKMKRPESVDDVQRFVGMVKYLGKYLPRLSDVCEPLRRLTHKGVEFHWGPEQDKAFEEIKNLVSNAPVLRYFDESAATEGQGDASQNGLGFVLMQGGQPVSYASRALTSAECRYSQIEKELLALVFGLERHHEYAYGRDIVLWTDHKPLVAIVQKPLNTAPKRLQRLLIRLNQYSVELKYLPGKEMLIADTLSRAYMESTERSATESEVETIHLMGAIPVSQPTEVKIRDATQRDVGLQAVSDYVKTGWPNAIRDCKPEAKPYYAMRNEITCDDSGCVFKGLRVIIPHAMRTEIRQKLHVAHTGLESTLARARESVFWPGMKADLEDYVSKCEACNAYPQKQQKETLINHELPSRPWQKIGCDIFTLDGNDYLCTVDYFSDYWEIDNLKVKKDASAVITRLKRHFATHGVPEIVQSDNGPPFNSHNFAEFADNYNFTHTTSSPEYPQSNGKVENAVKLAKRVLKKSKRDGGDFYMSLLVWRNTPTAGMNSSPAQRMFSRRLRNNLPMKDKLLNPEPQTNVRELKRRRQEQNAKVHDRSATELPELKHGDTVRLQFRAGQPWTKAKVLCKVGIRSYKIITESGVTFRRNRRALKKTNEHFEGDDIEIRVQSDEHENVRVQQDNRENAHPEVRRSTRQRREPAYLKDYVYLNN